MPILCCQQLPCGERLQFIGRIFRLLPTPLPFDALNEGDPLELLSSYGVRENRKAALQSQSFGHNTSTCQTQRETVRQTATDVAPTHCIGRQVTSSRGKGKDVR